VLRFPSLPAIIIGESAAGRPLEVYRFGDGDTHRKVIVAGIHGGNEWNTIALADELILHLSENPAWVAPETTLYILRSLNPDGEARQHGVAGRVNENGVDLNRNFTENWQRTWPQTGCWIYAPASAGERPGSEPETQALMAFLRAVRPEALISYHSAALGIFPGGEPADPASIRLAETLALATGYAYPPIQTGCRYTGTLPDFAVSLGAAAVDLELTDHVHTDLEKNLKALRAFLNWLP
jgi:predicted deacylase